RVQGKSRTLRKVRAQKPDNQQVEIEKGPFVLCVDASGSMSGFPEQSAKAMAYALMQIALAEGRDCYVILFSTEQITYELTKQDGLREAA
ncbi:protein viaA, partial [Vibrio vulnificus]